MPVYQSNAELSFNHCMHIDFYVQNGPEAMKDNLSGAANIIHVLLNTSQQQAQHPARQAQHLQAPNMGSHVLASPQRQ
ncbi:hypothetical protein RSOLAG1IB_11243 [Rhizoctonia solani AG-1 IB]|uniref:Uncharacterized protein n=1 Tax=Thanatephorus cucumeris (strain AG1-IB / isolate 7/3/14) TaxID=1108050 RepID=A0A0B7F4Z0_THACB|nr:hypothetical protein RSOLAG1IB_11243 [Rhizoctonia solani AG-1 IB]